MGHIKSGVCWRRENSFAGRMLGRQTKTFRANPTCRSEWQTGCDKMARLQRPKTKTLDPGKVLSGVIHICPVDGLAV